MVSNNIFYPIRNDAMGQIMGLSKRDKDVLNTIAFYQIWRDVLKGGYIDSDFFDSVCENRFGEDENLMIDYYNKSYDEYVNKINEILSDK
jgi:hypothetical protein